MAVEHGKGNNPPIFLTGKTANKKYANELPMSFEIMEYEATSDKVKF